jgi:hypothetical protein
MARGGPEVDNRVARFAGQKRLHVGRTDFHLEGARHTVKRLQHSRCFILSVLMQVDKARCSHEPVGIDRARPGERLSRNTCDAAADDAYIADLVEAGFRIEHPPPADHQIVICCPGTSWRARRQNQGAPSLFYKAHMENGAP